MSLTDSLPTTWEKSGTWCAGLNVLYGPLRRGRKTGFLLIFYPDSYLFMCYIGSYPNKIRYSFLPIFYSVVNKEFFVEKWNEKKCLDLKGKNKAHYLFNMNLWVVTCKQYFSCSALCSLYSPLSILPQANWAIFLHFTDPSLSFCPDFRRFGILALIHRNPKNLNYIKNMAKDANKKFQFCIFTWKQIANFVAK